MKTKSALSTLGGVLLIVAAPVALAQSGDPRPRFTVDTGWPIIPSGWVLGEVTSIAVDTDDHVWVLHRPRSIPEDEQARAAPPVLEFDQDGALLTSWGGPGPGYDWPEREHGIWVDRSGFVWISGNGGWPRPAPGTRDDDFVLKFTADGEFVLQIGAPGESGGNDDTENLHQPADQFVDESAGELYVADGYGNQRVIVFDATTGEFKRTWGIAGAGRISVSSMPSRFRTTASSTSPTGATSAFSGSEPTAAFSENSRSRVTRHRHRPVSRSHRTTTSAGSMSSSRQTRAF